MFPPPIFWACRDAWQCISVPAMDREFLLRFGIAAPNTRPSFSPAEFAHEVEARGYESFWVGEHSHIPVSTQVNHPSGGMAMALAQLMSPLISLAAASAV